MTRPALCVRDIREQRAVGIVVYRLDRLVHDSILHETLLHDSMSVRVFSTFSVAQELITDDLDDPSPRLIRQVLGAVGEYERSLFRPGLSKGRRRRAERRGAHGSPR